MIQADLKKVNFLLGIDENWDTHIDVVVNFIEKVSINDHTYYLFIEKSKKQSFYLTPRYVGENIEDVGVKKQIVVNISKKISDDELSNTQLPLTYATGLLQLHSGES